ncbi:MAG: NUDIX hydrolase [Anaerolineae bacterium]|nr:NUDIX hydrolase [Anaerolineae bacterium]
MDPIAIERLLHSLSAYPRPQGSETWIAPPDIASHAPDGGVPDEYRRALDDLLTALGLLSAPDGSPPTPSSPSAYYFLQSLIHGIREGAFAGMWRESGGQPEPTGRAWLGLAEAQRLISAPDATPLRSVRAVMGIIKTVRGGQALYLMQYDHGARQYQPIGGKVEADDENNVAALAREMSEELNLPPLVAGRDFDASPLKEHVRYRTISASLNVLTEYEHSFYHLRRLHFAPALDEDTVWLSADELSAGRARDGRAISPLLFDNLAPVLPSLEDSFAGKNF